MRAALFLLLMMCATQAQAVFWFQFQPCGFASLKQFADPVYATSPNLSIILWRISPNAVIQIIGLPSKAGELQCSWLSVNGDQWLVVGAPRELYEILSRRVMPEFADIEKRN